MYGIFFVYILCAVLVSVPNGLGDVTSQSEAVGKKSIKSDYDLPSDRRVLQDGYPLIFQGFRTLHRLEHFIQVNFALKARSKTYMKVTLSPDKCPKDTDFELGVLGSEELLRSPEDRMTFYIDETDSSEKPVLVDLIIKEDKKEVQRIPIQNIKQKQELTYNEIAVTVSPDEVKMPELRAYKTDTFLCDGEKKFIEKRKVFIQKAIGNLLNEEIQKTEVPNIALMGSGGGYRAMIAMSGVMNALNDTRILDSILYTAALSGSSWYLAVLYSHLNWPEIDPRDVQNILKRNVTTKKHSMAMAFTKAFINYVTKQNLTTEYFGPLLGDSLIPDRLKCRWSEQATKLNEGTVPLPLLAAIHAKPEINVEKFHDWVEFSPYEVNLSKYGTAIKMEHFGRKFQKGHVQSSDKELPLYQIMGICGSAYTLTFEELHNKGTNVEKRKNVKTKSKLSKNKRSNTCNGGTNHEVSQNGSKMDGPCDQQNSSFNRSQIDGSCNKQDGPKNGHRRQSQLEGSCDELDGHRRELQEETSCDKFDGHHRELQMEGSCDELDGHRREMQEETSCDEFDGHHRELWVEGSCDKLESHRQHVQKKGSCVGLDGLCQTMSNTILETESDNRQEKSFNDKESKRYLNDISIRGCIDTNTDGPHIVPHACMVDETSELYEDEVFGCDEIDLNEPNEEDIKKLLEKLSTIVAVDANLPANNTGIDELDGFCNYIPDSVKKWFLQSRTGKAAEINNFLRKLSFEDHMDSSSKTQFENILKLMKENEKLLFIDAGLALNSPYPLLFQPRRDIDLILSFDFTDRHEDSNPPFKMLLKASEWAKQNNIKFPNINIGKFEGKPIEEVYVFGDDEDVYCPTIMHFVLVNRDFWKYEKPTGEERSPAEKERLRNFKVFDTGNYNCRVFNYTEQMFDDLAQLAEFIVLKNVDKIKDCIREVIKKKKKQKRKRHYTDPR